MVHLYVSFMFCYLVFLSSSSGMNLIHLSENMIYKYESFVFHKVDYYPEKFKIQFLTGTHVMNVW